MSGMPMMSAMQPQTGMATDDQKNVIKANLAVVYSNMGACHLKNGNYKRAIEVCDTALKHDPTNVKAKFRRAQAKLAEGNLAGAEADLNDLGEKGTNTLFLSFTVILAICYFMLPGGRGDGHLLVYSP
jgi:tetratricopeptide (TPR) repeat protein